MSKVTYEARPRAGQMTLIYEVRAGGDERPVARPFRDADARLFAAALNTAEALPDDVDPVKAVEALPKIVTEMANEAGRDSDPGSPWQHILTRIKKGEPK